MDEIIDLIQDYGQQCEDRDMTCYDTLEQIKSLLESLEKDAARLDWMIDEQVFMECGGCRYWLVFPDGSEQRNSHQSAREAIDTAMQANKD